MRLHPLPARSHRVKRSFLLIEVLLAFLVAAICLLPLISGPLRLLRAESKRLEQIEKERLANWTFSEVKEKLLKNEIPWKELPLKGKSTPHYSLSPLSLQLPGRGSKTIQRAFYITCRGEKASNKQIYRQTDVHVLLDKERYTYRLPLKKEKR